MKKVFISHASEDKEDFVEPLAKALKGKYEVWYDDYVLVAGCSLLEEISKGLKECDYGIVILSNNFFSKEWPQKELNALVSLETKTRKVIIPIWKGVTKYQVTQYSPILADKYALNADEGVMKIVQEIHRSIEYFEKGKASSAINSGFSKLKNSLEKKKEERRCDEILHTIVGVKIGEEEARKLICEAKENITLLLESDKSIGISINTQKDLGHHQIIEISSSKIQMTIQYRNPIANTAKKAVLTIGITESSYDYNSSEVIRSPLEYVDYSLYIDNEDNGLWLEENKIYTSEEIIDKWLNLFGRYLLEESS